MKPINTGYPLKVVIGDTLKAIRELNGIEIEKIKKLIDIDLKRIIDIEKGRDYPTIPELIKFCKLYKCSFHRILPYNHSIYNVNDAK